MKVASLLKTASLSSLLFSFLSLPQAPVVSMPFFPALPIPAQTAALVPLSLMIPSLFVTVKNLKGPEEMFGFLKRALFLSPVCSLSIYSNITCQQLLSTTSLNYVLPPLIASLPFKAIVLFYFSIELYILSRKIPPFVSFSDLTSTMASSGILSFKPSISDITFRKWSKGSAGVEVGKSAPTGIVYESSTHFYPLFGASDNTENQLSYKKPVVLFFLSLTCPIFRGHIESLEKLYLKHKKNFDFVGIYTVEAHAKDGWVLPENNAVNICIPYAQTIQERFQALKSLRSTTKFSWPVFIDSMDNSLMKAYNSWPIRLYIVDKGKIVYCGAQGPFGVDISQLESKLTSMIVS